MEQVALSEGRIRVAIEQCTGQWFPTYGGEVSNVYLGPLLRKEK
jgi:hypothetical protein